MASFVPLKFAEKRERVKEALLLLGNPARFLPASDDEKEDTSPLETNVQSSTPPPDTATPLKRLFNDEDESQGKEKKKKEEPHGGDTKDTDKKPKEVEPLEPYLVRLSNDVETEISFLRSSLDYHSRNDVYPFEDSLSLQEFMTDWLHVDVMEIDVMKSDLLEEIVKLKKKHEKAGEEIGRNLNAMEPLDRQAFGLAHSVWSTQCETEFLLDVEQLMTAEEMARKSEKESLSILGAEIVFLNSLADYWEVMGMYPFEIVNGNVIVDGMDDFIKNWVQIDLPADKVTQIIHVLRRKYQKNVGRMLKNVGILGDNGRVAFALAKKIWGIKIGN